MDVPAPVRIWDVDRARTRYYTSRLLGHAYASTLQEELHECCEEVGLAGVHQIAMDGPNVNWSVWLPNQHYYCIMMLYTHTI